MALIFEKVWTSRNKSIASQHGPIHELSDRCYRHTGNADVRRDPLATKKCPECGKDVSTKADKCPHCGASKKTTQYGCGTFIILIALGFVMYAIFAPGHSNRPSSSTAFSADTSEETQSAREELLQDIINAGIFHKIETTSRTARVYVTPQFLALPINDKERIVSAVAAWHYTSTTSAHVRLIDYRTGKTVGSFLPPGGLRMN